MPSAQGVLLFNGPLWRLELLLKFIQLRQHENFVSDKEIAVALIFEELFEVLLSQHVCKSQKRLHVAHVCVDRLDDVEDDVGIADSQRDFTEVLVGLRAQPRLEVFIRCDDQGEPEAPLSFACGGQRAAVDFAKDCLDRVRIILLEGDHALVGLLYDALSETTHYHQGEKDKSSL